MKKTVALSILFCAGLLGAQERQSPMETVHRFFDAFHAKDSLVMQGVFHPKARLLRSTLKNSKPVVVQNNLEKFIRAVATRKATPRWEERLGEPLIHQDQNLATVWVPFKFYLGDQLSHCGVNAFTLVWNETDWQILSLIDTGTKDCE